MGTEGLNPLGGRWADKDGNPVAPTYGDEKDRRITELEAERDEARKMYDLSVDNAFRLAGERDDLRNRLEQAQVTINKRNIAAREAAKRESVLKGRITVLKQYGYDPVVRAITTTEEPER